MTLSAAIVSRNYHEALALTASLAARDRRGRGYQIAADDPELLELCQSVVGHETVVWLLQAEPFAPDVYRPVLEAVLDEVRRELFPDTRKKRFLSLDALDADQASAVLDRAVGGDAPGDPSSQQADVDWLLAGLPDDDAAWLRDAILPRIPAWRRHLVRLEAARGGSGREDAVVAVRRNVALLRRFFPDGDIVPHGVVDGRAPLAENTIRDVYLQVYLGLAPTFPPFFLAADPETRAAVMTRTLVEEILESDPERVLETADESFCIAHKLQAVYRHFNYSLNRLLGNAWPDRIPPWWNSRSAPSYWDNPAHRVGAVRWLVEWRLGLSPESLFKTGPSRADFSAHGLSYMFNRHYNSVSKALAEAYPEREPWELGKVPFEFWTDESAARAVCWLVARKGWAVAELPEMVAAGRFTRKTFSEFGLATLFERRFRRSIARAVEAAWPGRFQPWEIGKVPAGYWNRPANVYRASHWLAAREGLRDDEILPAIRQRRLTAADMARYGVGRVLRRLFGSDLEGMFAPLVLRERERRLVDHKIHRKLRRLQRRERVRSLVDLLLHGLFVHDAELGSRRNRAPYERIERRRHLTRD